LRAGNGFAATGLRAADLRAGNGFAAAAAFVRVLFAGAASFTAARSDFFASFAVAPADAARDVAFVVGARTAKAAAAACFFGSSLLT
jgi:hypothetical protein